MKPPEFAYHRPATRDEAVSLLGSLDGDARVLAGGQSLIPLMNFRLAQPDHLVDIGGLAELDYVRDDDGAIRVGASTTQFRVESDRLVRERVPLLAKALAHVAHPPIRHRGTVCGSIAHADPSAELPAIAIALDASCTVASASGRRELGAAELIVGPFTTSLEPGEMLEQVAFPAAPRHSGSALVEIARTHGNFAVAGAAVQVELDGDGSVQAARIVVFGAGAMATRCAEAERSLEGQRVGRQSAQAAAALAGGTLTPSGDIHGSASYRARVAGVCVRRAIEQAGEQAAGRQQ